MPQNLRFITAKPFGIGEGEPIEGDAVELVADDGRVMFSILVKGPGQIEIRGVETCKLADGDVRTSGLVIRPGATNSVTIETAPYPR